MNAFSFLTAKRERKPGEGLTMMLDKGMGLVSVIDFLELSAEYVDLAKFGWGTSAVHERDLIKEKIDIYRSYGVIPYPGGTLLEVAYKQNKVDQYLEEAGKLGFEAIELSDGTVDMKPTHRENLMEKIKEEGFLIITEVGKKDPKKDSNITIQERIELVNFDINAGASKVIIEAREGGKGIGIFDEKGKVKDDELNILIENIDTEKIIWEAPQKDQQAYLILKFGANVNLGNIPPEEVTALETMRRGLRGDTLGRVNI